jgi:hypothetical protein
MDREQEIKDRLKEIHPDMMNVNLNEDGDIEMTFANGPGFLIGAIVKSETKTLMKELELILLNKEE